jgi:hypothetical protein
MGYHADANYLSTNPQIVGVYVNYQLYQMLQGFNLIPVVVGSQSLYQMIFKEPGTDFDAGTGLYNIAQTGMPFDTIFPINEVVIQTNLQIPMESSEQSTNLPIIIDWIPLLTIANYRNDLVYEPVVPYRQYDVTGDPVNLAFYVYRRTTSGVLSMMDLAPGASVSLKLMFTPKRK